MKCITKQQPKDDHHQTVTHCYLVFILALIHNINSSFLFNTKIPVILTNYPKFHCPVQRPNLEPTIYFL